MTAANKFTFNSETEVAIEVQPQGQKSSLKHNVTTAMSQYFTQLDGQPTTDLYQLVLEQVEHPLLEAVMSYTKNNQSKAAEMLGLNRGTLRKKLKQYDLL